jgi:hypothetical protein
MGNALVVYTTPEEAVAWMSPGKVRLRARRARRKQAMPVWMLEETARAARARAAWKKGMRAGGASWRDPPSRQDAEPPIPQGGVWEPPGEPRANEWWKKPELRRAHTRAVRKSLEDFLNRHLAELGRRVRTGWWILGKVRVRVSECRPVPEYHMRQFAREVSGAVRSARRAAKKEKPGDGT